TEKNFLPSDKKADKQKNLTQALFDYVEEETETPVASTSGTFKTSKTGVAPDIPSKETDSFKPINEISSAILLTRA
ncbi:12705_t:CDS:2, partial [Dentiscutata heterogama]